MGRVRVQGKSGVFTLIKAILLLLALGTTAGEVVELVHEAAAAAGLLGLGSLLVALLVFTGGLARELVDEIHV